MGFLFSPFWPIDIIPRQDLRLISLETPFSVEHGTKKVVFHIRLLQGEVNFLRIVDDISLFLFTFSVL